MLCAHCLWYQIPPKCRHFGVIYTLTWLPWSFLVIFFFFVNISFNTALKHKSRQHFAFGILKNERLGLFARLDRQKGTQKYVFYAVAAPGRARVGKCPPQIIFCPPHFAPPPQFLIISVETISR